MQCLVLTSDRFNGTWRREGTQSSAGTRLQPMRDNLATQDVLVFDFVLVKLKAMRVRHVGPQQQCYQAKDVREVLVIDQYLEREWRHQPHSALHDASSPRYRDAEEHALRAKGGISPLSFLFIINLATSPSSKAQIPNLQEWPAIHSLSVLCWLRLRLCGNSRMENANAAVATRDPL